MMKKAFTLIEVLSAVMIMGIVMVTSIKSVQYMNQIHQQNTLAYLALNRLDSEMSRLVMAYENYDPINFRDYDGNISLYKEIPSDPIIANQKYGLLISSGTDKRNFILIKNRVGSYNSIEDGDFVGLLNWEENLSSEDVNLTLKIEYPYIYHTDSDVPKLWDDTNTVSLKTSTKIK